MRIVLSTLLILIFNQYSCITYADARSPKIFVEYGDAFDYQCGFMVPNSGVTEDETKQVRTLVPEIQKIWDAEGDPLLRGLSAQTGKSFKRAELTVDLITCKAVIAVSHPTMINMKPFFKMGLEGNQAILVDTIFHELAHRFLDEHYSQILDSESASASVLIRKYSKDGPVVLAHVHLFALQKAVYISLKREADWKKAEAFMRKINDPQYVRALDIVSTEGYKAFLKELQ